MNFLRSIKSKKLSFFILFLIVISFIFFASNIGVYDVLNDRIYATLVNLNKARTLSPDILIVAIDDKTVKKIGKWPFPRSLYSRAINNIIQGSPDIIGVVLAFSEYQQNEMDKQLHKTLKSFPDLVIIPKYRETVLNKIKVLSPEPCIFSDIKMGHSLFDVSNTNVVKSFQPFKVFPALSLQILKLYYFQHQSLKPDKYLARYLNEDFTKIRYATKDTILIDYKRSSQQFLHLSFIDVLNNKFNSDIYKNKIVLIGFTDAFKTAQYNTPFTLITSEYSNSVEIQAQIIDSLIQFRNLIQVNNVFIYIYSILIAILFFSLIRNNTLLLQGLSVILLILLICFCCYSLFTYYAIWFPPAFTLVLVMLTFISSVYYSSTTAEQKIKTVLNQLHNDSSLPMSDIPTGFGNKVEALISLLNIINVDRQTIKTIINGINAGIVVFNKKGTILWVNDIFLLIINHTDIINKPIINYLEDIELEEVITEIKQNNLYSKEILFNEKYFLVTINAIQSNKNNFIAILNDITEMKRIDKLKSDMIRMISHELKSPITAIKLSADNILDIDNRDFAVFNANSIMNASEILLDTINNFLNLSKLENKMIALDLKPINIIDLINKSISLQTPLADAKNIHLKFVFDENLPEVNVDQKQILIVVNNLISNAIKYSLKETEVFIKAQRQNNTLQVSVKDQGIGIPENEVEKVFVKFFRSSDVRNRSIEGTGLGLSIVKQIIEMHQGYIYAESVYGEGSTFTFVLPLPKN